MLTTQSNVYLVKRNDASIVDDSMDGQTTTMALFAASISEDNAELELNRRNAEPENEVQLYILLLQTLIN